MFLLCFCFVIFWLITSGCPPALTQNGCITLQQGEVILTARTLGYDANIWKDSSRFKLVGAWEETQMDYSINFSLPE